MTLYFYISYIIIDYNLQLLEKLARTAAYGGLGEACGAKLASLAFKGASPPLWPPSAAFARPAALARFASTFIFSIFFRQRNLMKLWVIRLCEAEDIGFGEIDWLVKSNPIRYCLTVIFSKLRFCDFFTNFVRRHRICHNPPKWPT